jgi:ribose 5-phosphate isomerase A
VTTVEDRKRAAAEQALPLVQPGMRVGLGTGTTARHFIELLGERVRDGLTVTAVPTSEATRTHAARVGIPLSTLDDTPELDLTVDGADEIGPDLTLIKGGGGALLWEKIVAAASDRMVVIADDTKWVPVLGHFPLPIEVVPFGVAATRRAVETAAAACGCSGPVVQRRTPEGHPFVTDSGHHLLDASLGRIPDPEALAAWLAEIPGVVEHGLFIGLAAAAILAGPEGVKVVEAKIQSRFHRISCKSRCT